MSIGGERDAGGWRHTNLGRLLSNSIRRFEGRVLELLEASGQTPIRFSHIGVTRNLDLDGTRIGDLARRAGMTKQAMSELVRQCEAAGLVARGADSGDRRAQRIVFTRRGLAWLAAFKAAVEEAEAEMRGELGDEGARALVGALERYGRAFDPLARRASE